jgi:hypothetical protein
MECLDRQLGIQGDILDREAQQIKGRVEKLAPWYFFLLLNNNIL